MQVVVEGRRGTNYIELSVTKYFKMIINCVSVQSTFLHAKHVMPPQEIRMF